MKPFIILSLAGSGTWYWRVSKRDSKEKLTIVWDLDQTLMNSQQIKYPSRTKIWFFQ
jgi:hypothetical protein